MNESRKAAKSIPDCGMLFSMNESTGEQWDFSNFVRRVKS